MGLREERLERLRHVDLYPVLTGEFTAGREVLDVLKAIGKGGAKIVQLREKDLTKRELLKLAVLFRKICSAYGMLMIVDDHIDVALACGADGVHLGQDDLPIAPARIMAPELIIGQSTHSIAQAVAAQDAGADYINLGPIFPTSTKNVAVEPLGTEIIAKAAPLLDIPFTVMGGIKERHLHELISLGATKIAMVTEVTQANDVEAKVRDLRDYWRKPAPEHAAKSKKARGSKA